MLRTPQFSYAFTKLEQDSVTRDVFSTFKLPINILDIPDLVCILKSQNFEIQHTQLIEYETEYTIEQAMDVFKSGAATPYLNPTAYSVPLTEEYINGFWRVIETSLKEQLSNNKIILGFPRCFIIHLTHFEKRKNLSIPIEDLFHNKKLLNKFNVDDIIEIGRLYARYKFTKDK